MPRNTFILTLLLAVFAAAVVAVNLAGSRGNSPISTEPTPTPAQAVQTQQRVYTDPECGISFRYTGTVNLDSSANGTLALTDTTDAADSVHITCQKAIPRPTLPADKIEHLTSDSISSLSATLYHDVSPKDGSPLDTLIFSHPSNGKEISISGAGALFTEVTNSLSILQ
ncbi:hypothetical protein M1555_01665 [Patescibacteria group bacterium]|nr:hypothetical protein [Patescibacteria group bacterium]